MNELFVCVLVKLAGQPWKQQGICSLKSLLKTKKKKLNSSALPFHSLIRKYYQKKKEQFSIPLSDPPIHLNFGLQNLILHGDGDMICISLTNAGHSLFCCHLRRQSGFWAESANVSFAATASLGQSSKPM